MGTSRSHVGLALVLGVALSGGFARGDDGLPSDWLPEIVDSDYHTGYLPDGYDTNDNVQLVAEGLFPNTCFKPASVKTDVDHEARTIRLDPKAYYYEGFCLQMLVPHDKTIEVGLLQEGGYEVVQKNGAALGGLRVKRAKTREADDFLYAPVSQAYFERQGGKRVVRIAGEFSTSCTVLTEVVVSVQPQVIVLQPITAIPAGADCRSGKFPFEKIVELPSDVKAGRYLLHVRSLSGKSVNTLVDI